MRLSRLRHPARACHTQQRTDGYPDHDEIAIPSFGCARLRAARPERLPDDPRAQSVPPPGTGLQIGAAGTAAGSTARAGPAADLRSADRARSGWWKFEYPRD